MSRSLASFAPLTQHVDAVASHYGFTPLERYVRTLPPVDEVTRQKPAVCTTPFCIPEHPEHRALTHGARALHAHGLHEHAGTHLFYTTHKEPAGMVVGFHTIDLAPNLADTLLIQATRSLLRSMGHTHTRVRLNTIGDKDSKKRFGRELGNFFRRHFGELPPSTVPLVSQDVFLAYQDLIRNNTAETPHSPVPIDYLNEKSRRHLREILNYLELDPDAYELDPRLIAEYIHHAGMVFTADVTDADGIACDEQPCIIHGGRYDPYIHTYVDPSRIGAGVTFTFASCPEELPETPARMGETPRVALVEIGLVPKMYGLSVMDTLFMHGIPIQHALTSFSLSEQLAAIAAPEIRFIIIVGEHETQRREVIIRDRVAERQQTIPLKQLGAKLASLLARA